ncbi:protein-tyrosine phosphatase-like protein [Lipomyces kononenkoae]|uniref:Protein-tyrosine phosphatase-like protein n=1 Tax=Lipomyces kononenkoae TaxID=34357 RepID=A0ACC3SXA9_LIPKO
MLAPDVSHGIAALDRSRAPALPRTLVPPCFFTDPSVVQEWRYESRRLAQQVYPHLWLGPRSVAKDEKFLRDNNVKLVLAVTTPQAWQIMKSGYADKSEYQGLTVSNYIELVKSFPRAKQLIDETKNNGGSTLLYCETGNEKSAAVAVAYVMESNGWDLIRSIQFVQARRFCVALDDNLKFQLRSYETLCQAHQAVLTPSKRPDLRRTLDDLYEDSHEIGEVDREGRAPFDDIDDNSLEENGDVIME